MPSNSRIQLSEYLKSLVIHGAVADIGCQDNRVSRMINDFTASDYVTFEKDQKNRERYDADAVLDLNLMTIERGHKYYEKFDYVFCLEVFEYITDFTPCSKNLYNLVKPGGKLITSWVFIYPQHGKDDLGGRLTEYGANYIFQNAGFSDISFVERVAKDKNAIKAFYSSEGYHCPELRDPHYSYPVGFIMEAIK